MYTRCKVVVEYPIVDREFALRCYVGHVICGSETLETSQTAPRGSARLFGW